MGEHTLVAHTVGQTADQRGWWHRARRRTVADAEVVGRGEDVGAAPGLCEGACVGGPWTVTRDDERGVAIDYLPSRGVRGGCLGIAAGCVGLAGWCWSLTDEPVSSRAYLVVMLLLAVALLVGLVTASHRVELGGGRVASRWRTLGGLIRGSFNVAAEDVVVVEMILRQNGIPYRTIDVLAVRSPSGTAALFAPVGSREEALALAGWMTARLRQGAPVG